MALQEMNKDVLKYPQVENLRNCQKKDSEDGRESYRTSRKLSRSIENLQRSMSSFTSGSYFVGRHFFSGGIWITTRIASRRFIFGIWKKLKIGERKCEINISSQKHPSKNMSGIEQAVKTWKKKKKKRKFDTWNK